MLIKVSYEQVEAMRQHLIDCNYSTDGLAFAADFQNSEDLIKIENIVGENICTAMFSTHTGDYDNIFVSFLRPSFSHNMWYHYVPDDIFADDIIASRTVSGLSNFEDLLIPDGTKVWCHNTELVILGYSHCNIFSGTYYYVYDKAENLRYSVPYRDIRKILI